MPLEGILVTLIVGYALSYIAVKVIAGLIEWETRRKNTPEKIQKRIDQEQKRWLSSPEFQKLNQERLNKLQP